MVTTERDGAVETDSTNGDAHAERSGTATALGSAIGSEGGKLDGAVETDGPNGDAHGKRSGRATVCESAIGSGSQARS